MPTLRAYRTLSPASFSALREPLARKVFRCSRAEEERGLRRLDVMGSGGWAYEDYEQQGRLGQGPLLLDTEEKALAEADNYLRFLQGAVEGFPELHRAFGEAPLVSGGMRFERLERAIVAREGEWPEPRWHWRARYTLHLRPDAESPPAPVEQGHLEIDLAPSGKVLAIQCGLLPILPGPVAQRRFSLLEMREKAGVIEADGTQLAMRPGGKSEPLSPESTDEADASSAADVVYRFNPATEMYAGYAPTDSGWVALSEAGVGGQNSPFSTEGNYSAPVWLQLLKSFFHNAYRKNKPYNTITLFAQPSIGPSTDYNPPTLGWRKTYERERLSHFQKRKFDGLDAAPIIDIPIYHHNDELVIYDQAYLAKYWAYECWYFGKQTDRLRDVAYQMQLDVIAMGINVLALQRLAKVGYVVLTFGKMAMETLRQWIVEKGNWQEIDLLDVLAEAFPDSRYTFVLQAISNASTEYKLKNLVGSDEGLRIVFFNDPDKKLLGTNGSKWLFSVSWNVLCGIGAKKLEQYMLANTAGYPREPIMLLMESVHLNNDAFENEIGNTFWPGNK